VSPVPMKIGPWRHVDVADSWASMSALGHPAEPKYPSFLRTQPLLWAVAKSRRSTAAKWGSTTTPTSCWFASAFGLLGAGEMMSALTASSEAERGLA
jgi:hypothetical protein